MAGFAFPFGHMALPRWGNTLAGLLGWFLVDGSVLTHVEELLRRTCRGTPRPVGVEEASLFVVLVRPTDPWAHKGPPVLG